MKVILAYLRLARPANILTAIADILLGFVASGVLAYNGQVSIENLSIGEFHALGWLVLATIGLYGGGVIFNDVFDYELDKVERPERPLPSQIVSLEGATIWGASFLLVGTLAAFQVRLTSGIIATIIVVLVLLYDIIAKKHPFWGPLVMGSCRAANLCLGISISPPQLFEIWYIGFIPLLYIAAITLISRGEVHGGNRGALFGASWMYALVLGAVLSIGTFTNYNFWMTLPFLGVFLIMVIPPLIRAMKDMQAKNIGKAVKMGVLALIPLDASMAAGFAGWEYGLFVLFLLPLSLLVAKLFAVT